MRNRLVGIVMTIGLAILTMVGSVECAWAEKRIALAIGNSDYESVPKLPNPSRDAIAIGQMFRDAGFDSVDVLVDVTNQELKRALRKFASDVDQADVAVIFYAGHGLEISGTNYLIPVDAKLASDRDAEDEAVRLDRVISAADGASKLRVIILDACRDNPFTSLMRRNKANHPVSSGLGKSEPTSTDTLIAYAAKAGSVAEDGDSQHSPFTSAILKSLTIPGLDIRLAFGRVKDEVMRVTGSRQEPFVYGSLGGSNFPLVPAPKVQGSSEADIRGDYELVAKVGTRRAWDVFLNTYKTGFYADLARAQMAALPEEEQVSSNSVIRSKGGQQPSGGRDSSSQEAIEWNKIKGSSDPAMFENFIQRFPNAPLAVIAQKKLDVLRQAQREREAAQKAAEEARVQAEQKRAAEAAAKKREEEERRAKAAEAEQKAMAAEAERKAAAERQKAEQAARERAAAEAAAARAAAKKQAKEAEEARKRAEWEAKEAECKAEQSQLDQIIAKGSAGTGMDELKAFGTSSKCERLSTEIAAATGKFKAEQAKREREAAQRAAEEARIEAEKKKAEAAAAQKREDDERRAREAEAAEKAKAAAAELAAAKKREEDERRAKALEAEQQAKAAEEKRKAERAEQQRLAAEAAAQRLAAEKQAREEQRRAEQAEAEQKARAAEAERLAAEEKRKAEQAAREATCNTELAKLLEIVGRGSDGSGMDDLNAFAKSVTCDKLGAKIAAALGYFKKEVAARAAAQAQRDREAAQNAAAEEARIQAEQKKAAEIAAKKREEEERRARAAEAEQKAMAAEAERKAAAERQKAEQATRERVAAEAAARAAAEKQAKEAEEARMKAERDAKEAACRNEQSRLDQIIARGSEGSGMDELNAFARAVTCDQLGAQIVAATDKFKAEQANREREAAQKAAENARLEAERKKAEAAAAAKKKEDDERRAREVEAAEKAKAAAAELAAAKMRDEEERRAKALEAEQQAKAAEEKRKAEQAEQERAAAFAAAAGAEAEQKAKEDERRAKQAEAEQRVKAAEAERLAAEEKRKAEQAAKDSVCQAEQSKLEQILANGSRDSGIDDLNAFARSATCERLGAQIIGALEKFKAEAAQRAAAMPNSPQLILAAQTQLIRLGCELPGKPNGMLNDATKSALVRFMTVKGRATNDLAVTTSLVDDLTKQTDRVCPLECKANEVAKRDKCIAIEKPPMTSRRKDEEEETLARKKHPEKRQAEREPPRKPAVAEPQIRARVQAIARPTGGGGGGGSSAVVGVGF